MTKTILLIEDDSKIQKIICSYLEKENFQVITAGDGRRGLEIFQSREDIDLVLLDIMMPELDGWSVCRKIRQTSTLPIIILTARDEEDDEVYGFELMANDYVKKPFIPRVLIARINALLNQPSTQGEYIQSNVLKRGKIEINITTREVFVEGVSVVFTTKEFDILCLLAKNEKVVFSRDTILNKIWEYDYANPCESRLVDNHIKKIRKGLGNYAYYVNTVFGVGYKFEVK